MYYETEDKMKSIFDFWTLPSFSKPVADAGHHTGPASGLDQAIGHLESQQDEWGNTEHSCTYYVCDHV